MDREPAQKVDPAEEQRKKFLIEGEVWITNAGDQNHDFWKKRSHRKDEKSAQQLLQQIQNEVNAGEGLWESVRLVPQAFDQQGKPLAGIKAIVGTPRKQA
ncbi:hypothetical protein A2954_01180 [Candidatus Roizmanbacteria bacterium RIFCSPLOWO2_01_FULL_37_12]|uniref:Uncharacterized protein n=1 Tax=Candidatus Roizmanbacteria bacterium RIFCSPLOWO2_01_FULL_37_12 TaxID=1802056 RepID=A0A1F7IGG2_9BACT|nr:MAG: hypothetical protein A3D76_01670 [Candidatus Roizmanbacteria bacterium RIFCSPHIGHO2_02_FULL_37_9b]OGK42438.1 MAG: hypothetical protein A2954_01180 [Candidatus Roizmanbacteria bacterium RIFCSPLOWO2_01_FULL_37_12]